jgi:hypothetical protein
LPVAICKTCNCVDKIPEHPALAGEDFKTPSVDRLAGFFLGGTASAGAARSNDKNQPRIKEKLVGIATDWGENQWIQLSAGLNLFLPSGTWRERQSTVAGFSRGSWMIGGTTGGLMFWPDADRTTYLSLSPNVAYFLADRISVGANILFDYYHFGSSGERVSTGIMPVGRFYV